MNKETPTLPPINQMGLSKATEAFIWSVFDDDATTQIIAAHIKEKDDKIVKLKAQRDQAVEALINLCAVVVRLDIWEEDIDILDTRLTKEYNEARAAIAATEDK